MEITKNEIEKLFPSVYITLVSILLGFAVEDVVTRLGELARFEAFDVLAAGGILSGIIAAWIGYSFVSMTQERLPRVWDAIHVFFVAFGFYFLISTIGKETWWFFFALSIYQLLGTVATVYNANILAQSLTSMPGWRIFPWNILLTFSGTAIYLVSALAFRQELLNGVAAIFLAVYFILTNIAWAYFFYRGWSDLVERLS